MNPAFRIALNETLGRAATPEEWFNYCATLQNMLGGTRVYIETGRQPDTERLARILELRGNGWSIRKIARKEGVSKSTVHDALSGILSYQVDSKAA